MVHRDSEATDDSDIVRSGWVPQGCLLETTVPPSTFASTPVSSAIPINPLSIISVSTPGVALMDYTPRGSDEISLKKEDRLRVFKRYNHWSYVIKETTGERGWTPSWFVGKVSGSSGSSWQQTTPTSAAILTGSATSGIPPGSGSSLSNSNNHSLNAVSANVSFGNGETTPTSALPLYDYDPN